MRRSAPLATAIRFSSIPPAQPASGAQLPRGMGLSGRAVITHVRLRLPRAWRPELGYLDLERKRQETGIAEPHGAADF
jgi:UDP-N-acetylmuramate dehydrogenase